MTRTGEISLRSRWILHFTHRDNLAAIIASGRIICDRMAGQHCSTEVGDPGIKESRRQRPVPVEPGGHVGDYVPFYYAPRSPMMFRIACDHRDGVAGRYSGGDRPLVYLVARIGSIIDLDLAWVGTDGNAANATTEFSSDPSSLDRMIDWSLMHERLWKNTLEDPDRQRRRMAELLVHREVSTSIIDHVGTYSDNHAGEVRAILRDHELENRVFVRPDWYYGLERGR